MAVTDYSEPVSAVLAQSALPLALLLFAIGIVLFLFRGRVRRLWLDMKTRRLLKKLGIRQMTDFQCPDGLGHYYSVDRVLMRRDGISLLLFRRFPGSIFCAEHISEWTQLLRGKSYRFKNPLVDLDHQIKAVSACIPGIAVDGYIFFDHTAVFPKGHPERVIHLDAIPQSLALSSGETAQPAVAKAWEQLRAIKQSS